MIEAITDWWFGDWTDDLPQPEQDPQMKRWWMKDPATDALIIERWGHLLEADLAPWEATPRGALAKVLVLDQFSRVVHRGSGRAFAQDVEARATVSRALARGFDRALAPIERSFLYMPLMHSEDLADHDRALELFGQLVEDTAGTARAKGYEMTLHFEHKHREIVARFGRYPHRNAALGRASTAQELEFLEQPGSSF